MRRIYKNTFRKKILFIQQNRFVEFIKYFIDLSKFVGEIYLKQLKCLLASTVKFLVQSTKSELFGGIPESVSEPIRKMFCILFDEK